MSPRPTWAQVSAVEALLDLILLCEDSVAIIAMTSRTTLRSLRDSAEILIPLVDADDEWVDVAMAFDADASAMLRRMLWKATR